MKRTIQLLVWAIFALSCTITSSRGQPAPLKWELNLNLYPLVVNGTLGVMIRYAPTSRGAFRLAFNNVEFGRTKGSKYIAYLNGPPLDTVQTVTSGFGYGRSQLGYEFRVNSGKHQLYYGLDLGFFYHSEKHNPADVYATRVFEGSVIPFVGLKYRILDRLSVSTELGGIVKRRYEHIIGHRKETISDYKMWGFSVDGLRLLNITYHF